ALSGTVLLSLSTSVPLALAALALAAMGSSVLFPTLLSRATHDVAPDCRGRATSAVATTSYLGFVLGPWYVGVIAGVVGLRGALIGVALLAAAFAILAPAVSARRPEPAATGPAGR
ncbi:MAG: MFS transporter, partial [Kineosporiaceae bacterium]